MKMIMIGLYVPVELRDRIKKVAGHWKMSTWIRQAITEKLERD